MSRELAIGFATHLGWAAAAVVGDKHGVPEVIATARIETAPPGDRTALEAG